MARPMPYGWGRVFQRGDRFWSAYFIEKREIREPGGLTRKEAEAKLNDRLAARLSGDIVLPRHEKTTITEIVTAYVASRQGKPARH